MPYLDKDFKSEVNIHGSVKRTSTYLSSLDPQHFAGALNYFNFVIVKKYLEKNGKRYWILALITGTLVCCIFEIYRRITGPYEDTCINKNGDV